MKVAKIILTTVLILLHSTSLFAIVYKLDNPYQDVIGKIKTVKIQPGDTLEKIARRYCVTYLDLLRANPQLEEHVELLAWHKIVIPSQHILPRVSRNGIVINLPELKLYYFISENEVMVAPIGIGREGWATPTGDTEITIKIKNPNWTPTKSVREAALEEGKKLPKVVPSGPDNPLGHYAILLGWKSYLIHGTNKPEGVGKRSSAGCFRMYPEDIEFIYHSVHRGTPVTVVNQPVKVGWFNQSFMMQAFPRLKDYPYQVDNMSLVSQIHEQQTLYSLPISWRKIGNIMNDASGMPATIGHREKSHMIQQPQIHSELGRCILLGQTNCYKTSAIPKKILQIPLKEIV